MTQEKEYKIVFLIYAEMNDDAVRISRMEFELNEQVKRIEFSENFHLIIVKNSVRLKKGAITSDKTGIAYKNKQNKLQGLVPPLENENILQDGKRLGEVFRMVENLFPSRKVILITLDHGNGFGIFQKQTREAIGSSGSKQKSSKQQTWFGDKIVSFLTNDELKKAIKEGFGKADVLIMFNCLMQNMLTCYSMKDVVDYMVAAESVIADPGFDYVSIARETAVSALPVKIAYTAIDTLKGMYRGKDEKNYTMQAVSALNLKEFSVFVNVVDAGVKVLIKLIREKKLLRSEIRSVRSKCYPFDHDYGMIDVLHFFEHLAEAINHKEIREIASEIHKAYRKIVVKEPPIEKFEYRYVGNYWGSFHNKKPSGLSIHFPTSGMEGNGDVKMNFTSVRALYPSTFLAETSWRDFINCLYQ